MRVYTKILLGMAVGVFIGLALGPKSPFLAADTYLIKDASTITLLAQRDDPVGQALPLASLPIRLEVVDPRDGKETSREPARTTAADRVLVQFPFTVKLALRDRRGDLRAKLGDPAPGDMVQAWLVVKRTELKGGNFVTTPEAVSGLGNSVIAVLRPFGTLFLRLIKMVIVPLVFASLLVGVASLGDVRKLGRLGGKTLLLYLGTTATAVTIGLMLAHLVGPGYFIASQDRATLVGQFQEDAAGQVDAAARAPSVIDNILSIIPENPVESLASGTMLQVIFFALIFGIALTLLQDAPRSRQVVSFFDTVQQAMIIIIHIVMFVAPFGVAALVAEVVGTSGWSVLRALIAYALTVLLGLLVLAGLVYAGLVRIFCGIRWLHFMQAARPAQLIAFSTSSSSATLPVTLECAEENLGVSKAVASFVIPLGSTVNMDGTALYQGVAAMFIAQVFAIDLSAGAQVGIVLTATMASIGAAGVPGAGMITLAMVLTAAGIPPVGIALILGVDRLLDMFRSAVNVTGDLAVSCVMASSEGERLVPLTAELDESDPDRGFEGRLPHAQHPLPPAEASGKQEARVSAAPRRPGGDDRPQ